MPKILVFQWEQRRQRLWARRSEMNEADEAISRIGLASIDEPSGALTKTQQVMSRKSNFNPMAVLETTVYSVVLVGEGMGGVSPWLSTWSKVWCGFWHFLHLWRDIVWQTIHAQVVRLECGNLLVMWHQLEFGTWYKGCFSVLQARHRLVVELVLAANKATGLLDAKRFLAEGDSCFDCCLPTLGVWLPWVWVCKARCRVMSMSMVSQ